MHTQSPLQQAIAPPLGLITVTIPESCRMAAALGEGVTLPDEAIPEDALLRCILSGKFIPETIIWATDLTDGDDEWEGGAPE